jgi:putative endonuclease
MNSSPENSQTPPEHLELGRRGEELAAAYLQQAGYRLVASNFTVPVGRNRNDALINVEIDLVAYEGPVLCFIEVKTRMSDWFASPSANVDLRKQRQITRAARAYRRMLGLIDEVYRFDVVSVLLPPNSTDFEIELTRNFWSEEKFRPSRRPQAYWD